MKTKPIPQMVYSSRRKFKESPRLLPGGNKDQSTADLLFYTMHLIKKRNATAIIDTHPPKMNPNNYLKTQSLINDARRLNMIERENKDMVKKINVINRSTGYVDTWNTDYALHRCSKYNYTYLVKMQTIDKENVSLFKKLVKAESIYQRKVFEEEYKEKVKLNFKARFPNRISYTKSFDEQLREQPSISCGLNKLCERPLVYFDIEINAGIKLGRMLIELYSDYAPMTCQNFLAISNGEKNLSYENCPVHSIFKDQFLVSGDTTKGNGKGGSSIYGDTFKEESPYLVHSKAGVLSMIRVGNFENNSQFSITLTAMPKLDYKQIVFGRVFKGAQTLLRINDMARKMGRPTEHIYIAKCGSYPPRGGKKEPFKLK